MTDANDLLEALAQVASGPYAEDDETAMTFRELLTATEMPENRLRRLLRDAFYKGFVEVIQVRRRSISNIGITVPGYRATTREENE
jgi:hypothetical protein